MLILRRCTMKYVMATLSVMFAVIGGLMLVACSGEQTRQMVINNVAGSCWNSKR